LPPLTPQHVAGEPRSILTAGSWRGRSPSLGESDAVLPAEQPFLCCVCLLAGWRDDLSSERSVRPSPFSDPKSGTGCGWPGRPAVSGGVSDAADGKLLMVENWKDCSTQDDGERTDVMRQLRQSARGTSRTRPRRKSSTTSGLAFHRDREACSCASRRGAGCRETGGEGCLARLHL